MKSNTTVIYTVSIIGVFLLGYILWNIDYLNKIENSEKLEVNIDQYVNYDINSRKLSKNEYWGKMLFKSNCAACHLLYKLDSWPNLKNDIEKYPTDTSFFNYLAVIKSTEEGSRSKPFPELDVLQTTAIKEYLETLNK